MSLKKRVPKPEPQPDFDLEDYARRSTEASGVPEKVEDRAAIDKVTRILNQ